MRIRHSAARLRRVIFLIVFALSAMHLAAELFNEHLSDAEREQLYRGDIVIRYINTPEKICVRQGLFAEIDTVADAMRAVNANYLSEVLWAVPVSYDPDITDLAESFFCDMETFKEIPYYSEAFDTTEPLFTVADLLESETDGTETVSRARFCMDPFEPYPARLYMRNTKNAFVFLHTNTEKIKLAIVQAIGKDTMKAGIAIIQENGYWIVYGAGGIRGPKPPFFRKSLEKAFNNRIKDFATFYIKKVQATETKKATKNATD